MTTDLDIDADFAQAFADFESGKDVAASAAETQATETQATETQATEAQATEAQATEAQATETQATETQATETQATETQATETQATETQAAEEDKAYLEMKARLDAIEAEREAERARQEELKPAAEHPLYSTEEQSILDKYKEDWPDISKAEALVRRAEYRELVKYIFAEVRAQYDPALEYVNTRSGRDQYSDIVALVPDYDAVRDKALAWVDAQPAYLKAAFKEVTTNGSPEDVADLIARFKKETGYVQPQAASVTQIKPPTPAAALPPAAKKVAASLAVVKTGRSEQGQGVDVNDFGAGFAAAAAEEEARKKA